MTSWSSVGGLGRSRGLCWRSCATLGAYVGGLGPLLGPLLAVLGRLGLKKVEEHDYLENVLISRAGARAAASGCGLSPLLAVLGGSWGLCWRSWSALGAYVGGLGLLLGPM